MGLNEFAFRLNSMEKREYSRFKSMPQSMLITDSTNTELRSHEEPHGGGENGDPDVGHETLDIPKELGEEVSKILERKKGGGTLII